MTLALGATFPARAGGRRPRLICRHATPRRVYTANTLGAIAGALVAGFALIPTLGLRSTFQWTAIAGAARRRGLSVRGAAAATRRESSRKHLRQAQGRRLRTVVDSWFRRQPLVAAASSRSPRSPPFSPCLRGTTNCWPAAPTSTRRTSDPAISTTGLRAGTLEYYKEGAAATVSVRRLAGVRALAIDGKVDASNGGDMLTQRLLGLLPVALHGRAQDICVIGLGSGVTLGSALAPGDVRHADVIEISPEVVEASHFFDRENGNALAAPGRSASSSATADRTCC